MPKVVDATEQRREIRRAARRAFAQRGVRSTGLAHVADAAGMGRASLYHYYPDKAALVRDLAREVLDEEEALFASAARAPGSALERIERLAVESTRLFDSWAGVMRVVFDLRTLESARFRRFLRRIREGLADVVADGQRAGEIDPSLDPLLASAHVIALIDGLLIQHFAEPRAFPDREAFAAAVGGQVRKVLEP